MTDAEIRQEYAILEKAKKNPKAFGELYEKYFDRIFHFIYRQMDDEDVTADLTSQTFLSVLKHLDRYQFRGVPFSAWLYKIASNEVNKYYRKRKHDKVFSIEEVRVRELIEQGFEVAVVKDATAGPRHPVWGDGYQAAMINYRFLAHAVLSTSDAVDGMR